MWIIPKFPKSFHYGISKLAPDTEAFPSDYTELSEICAQSLIVRSKPTPARTWWRKWKRDSWTRRLFGRILKPSLSQTFTDAWTSSLRDSHASLFPAPEKEQPTATPDTSSLTSSEGLNSCGQELFSSKTSKGSSAQNSREMDGATQPERPFCSMSSENWKEWVTERRREYSARVKCAPPINESGSSSSGWQTITAQISSSGRKRSGLPNLIGQAEKWTTPQAHDVTPRGSGQVPNSKAGNACLARDAMNWPTTTRDWKDGSAEACKNVQVNGLLGRYVVQWPTPRSSPNENRNTKPAPSHGATHGRTLAGDSVAFHPVPQTSTDGEKSLKQTRRLNPRFVAWLMGVHPEWMNCDWPATESSPQPQQKPS